MKADLSRSDALRPLVLPLGLLATTFLGLVWAKAPQWALVVVGILFAMIVCVYAGIYIWFALNNADALRSERYSLHKIAIAKGLYGDSNIGLLDEGSSAIEGEAIEADPQTSIESKREQDLQQ